MTASKTAQTATPAPAVPVRAPGPPQTVVRSVLGVGELARFASRASEDRATSDHAARMVNRLPGAGAGVMLAAQRAYGNAHVQRMVARRERQDAGGHRRTDDHQMTQLSTDRDHAARTVEERRPSAPQASLRVSSPQDAAEKEAVNVARQVMRATVPATPATPVARENTIHREAAGPPRMRENTAAAIQTDMGSGTPLPKEVRRFMEPRFHADFSGVKIHTGERSAQLSRDLNAHAFTVGNHVFFGKDRYQPASDQGKELIAHELTHTIQQGGAAQRQAASAPVAESSTPQVQRGLISEALDYISDHLYVIPGFRMLTVILGSNPVTHEKVDRSGANILRAMVELVPGGALISEALANAGVFDRAGAFVEAQFRSLGMTAGMLWDALMKFLDSLGVTDIVHPGDVWDRAKRIFTAPIDRLIDFGKGLVIGIVTIIKDAILRPIAKLAQGTAGYDLLKAILGHDPITGDEVPQTAENIIEPFMRLIGQETIWENMKKANAIPRAFAWFKGALKGLWGFVSSIPGRFKAAFLSLEIMDIVLLPKAFAKVAGVFTGLVGQFISWAGGTIWNLLEIVFDVVSPGAFAYVKKTGAALKGILKNPLPFVGNLVKAAKLGFQNFAGNIVTHLKGGLIDWLTGSLPGVYIPKAFELGEVAKFAFSVLGLTWQNIRLKLVKAIGEPAVKAMETGFDIVVTLVRDGPAAAWDKIKEQLGNLKDMVVGGITDFVVDAIVKKAVPKLIAMFIPGAGFISAIISIYDTIKTFINQLSKIAQVVKGFVESIVAIAAGAIGGAANRIEGVLAGLLSLAINFFAGFVGLGSVAEKIRGVIEKIRAPIDKALEWLVGWIVATGKKLFAKAFGGGKGADKSGAGQKAGDDTTRKAFSLPEEEHTVTAHAVNGHLRVTIASEREMDILVMLQDAMGEVSSDPTKDPKQRAAIIGDLAGARKMVQEMGNDWVAESVKEGFDTWKERRMTQIVGILTHLGADGIKAFRDFKGKPLARRFLPPGYGIREALYLRGSRWSANQAAVAQAGRVEVLNDINTVLAARQTNRTLAQVAWDRLVQGERVPDGVRTMGDLTIAKLVGTQYDVDHIVPMSTHWQSGGGKGTDDTGRWNLSERSNLRYITQRDNLAKGKGSYEPWVEQTFVSIHAEGGQPNAKKIDGQPFLSAPGGPPV